MPKAPQRVLLYRLGSLGDHLIAIPCYKLVRKSFPGAEVGLLTNIPVAAKAAAAQAVLTGSGLVDSYITYVVGERNPLSLLKLIFRIRAYGADTLVYLGPARGLKATKRDKWFFRACGFKKQIGLPLTEDLQVNRSLGTAENGAPLFEPEASRLARCVTELGDARLDEQESWSPNLTEEERSEASGLLKPLAGKPFIGFSIGTKAQANHWGNENWSALFRELSARYPGYALVLTGAPDEFDVSETLADCWRESGNQALNLCGMAKPRPSAALMEQTRLFLGHDSGPGHLTASVGAPMIGVFSSRFAPRMWFPHGEKVRILQHWVDCGGCQLDVCTVERKKCILSITVPEVLAAADEVLANT